MDIIAHLLWQRMDNTRNVGEHDDGQYVFDTGYGIFRIDKRNFLKEWEECGTLLWIASL